MFTVFNKGKGGTKSKFSSSGIRELSSNELLVYGVMGAMFKESSQSSVSRIM